MPALTVVVRQSVTGMNPPSVHGVMLTACSIRAMFTANVRELNVITVVFNKSQHLLNGRTALLLFEGYAMMIMADVPRRKASRLLRCNEKTLASILSYWVTQAVEALDLSDVTKLAIDETPPHDAAKQNEQRTVDQAGSPLQGLSEDRMRLPDCPGFGPVLRLQG